MKRKGGKKPAQSPKAKGAGKSTEEKVSSDEGYDYWRDERRRIQSMKAAHVVSMSESIHQMLSDLLQIDKDHADDAVRMDAGRELADLIARASKLLPKLIKSSAGFKQRWSGELFVKGRMPPVGWTLACCKKIYNIHRDAALLLYTEVWNFVSPPSQQREKPHESLPFDAEFHAFLVKQRNWRALSVTAEALEHPGPALPPGSFAASLKKGEPIVPPPPRPTKHDLVDHIRREISREIAGVRFDQYWAEVLKARARAIYLQERDALPSDKKEGARSPAHALRTIKETVLSWIQQRS